MEESPDVAPSHPADEALDTDLDFDPAELARNPNMRVLLLIAIVVLALALALGLGWP